MEINIPQRLKSIREGRKLTQEKVAKAIGTKRGTYQTYEEGRATPGIPTLIKLSNFYGFHSLDQLLGIVENKEPEQPPLVLAYHSVDLEKRRIVDFILNLNC